MWVSSEAAPSVIEGSGAEPLAGAPAPAQCAVSYELCFSGLFNRGAGYAFPCDAQGHVDLDALTPRSRDNYLYARAVVGMELSAPIVLQTAPLPVPRR
jgi:hypothetical protein